MNTLKKIIDILTPAERMRAGLLLGMILIMAFLDMVGVASIMPFMAMLANPEVVETNRWLGLAYNRLGFEDTRDFLFFLGGVVFVALIVSLAFKAITQWALLRFTHMRGHSLASRLLNGYLGRPYIWFLNRHSADLGKSVLSEVGQVVSGVIIPSMQLFVNGAVVFFIVTMLVLVDPTLALTVAVVLGGSYLLIFMTVRRYLSRIGSDRINANKERFQVTQEALGGIKEVKVFGRERAFFRRFVNPSLRFARHQANHQIAGQMPRYLLEVVAFGGILLIALYLFKVHGNFNQVLPLLALYAFSGYRLLPALQHLYQNLTKIRFTLPALNSLHQDIIEFKGNDQQDKKDLPVALKPQEAITMKDVCFTYPGSSLQALKNLDFSIPAKSTIGLVGTTGSGKTTAVDIILGLLCPQTGQLLVDETAISAKNRRGWQRSLGYVPQQIYLADDNVAANIAFGIPLQDINLDAVERAARIAELHEFVVNDMPDGYDTMVGERGVRLSGGQRQRIGIARALYHDPEVLIFDEATSALDNITEQAVMEAVHNLGRKKTIILIAHRLSTVRACDRIYLLEKGSVVDQGNYEQLMTSSDRFRTMALAVDGK